MSDTCFRLFSEKNAPTGQLFHADGTININLDEIWEEAKQYKVNTDNMLISILIDVICHEWFHKVINEAVEIDTSNDQDERIFQLTTDWNQFGINKCLLEYD